MKHFKLLACTTGLLLSSNTFATAPPTYPDALLTTPASSDVVNKGLEADGYSLAISAYNWGYPLVRMERTMREYTYVRNPKPATSYRAPLNQIGWAQELATPSAKDMPTANNDTYYMSAVVDLTQPYIFTVPDTDDRYYVVDLFNMWQELEHYIGRRTTGTKAGKYVIVPPGYKGDLPNDATRLDVSTDKVWLWGRLHVKQGEDTAPLLAMQKQFTLKPLDKSAAITKDLESLPRIGKNEFGFFEHLSAAIKQNEIKPADAALFGQFTRIGLTEQGFDPSKLAEPVLKGMRRGLADAPSVAISSFASTATKRSGWDWVTGLDSFGYNYALRAVISGPYLGGQGEQEAMYPIRYTDSKGATLDGNNRYELTLPSTPPVNAFWSLTMYNADDKMLVENKLNRYKVGSDTPGLVTSKDGSITLLLSNKEPEGEFAPNWLPAPKGEFYVILRLYQPNDDILSGQWQLPELNKIN